MQVNGWLYLSSRWMPALIVAGIFSIFALPQPCAGGYDSIRSTSFSLNLREEPIGEVLKKISNDTGYQITVDSVWAAVPVSGSFKDLPMVQGLRRILSKLNYSIVFNEADHRIFIDIKSFHDGEGFQKGALLRAADDNPPGGLRSSAANLKDAVNPGDIQVIPPTKPGEVGITLKEIQEIEAQRVKISPEDIEVIPPSEVGGKGVSLKESNAQQNLQKPAIFKETELVPPDGFDRK